MEIENTILSPTYNREKGLTLGFVLSVLFCSKIEEVDRQVIYLFHVGRILDLRKIGKDELTHKFLLQKIFDVTRDKKLVKKQDLRMLTKFSKPTFNKYFDKHLESLGLSMSRSFSLSETFKILQFWQGEDKWGRMKAFTKIELAERFTNKSYDNLELEITHTIIDFNYYSGHDYIKPADAKQFAKDFFKEDKESLEQFYEEEFNSDYLTFFSILLLLNSFDVKKNQRT